MREALRGEGCGCQVSNGLQLQLPGRVGARGWPRVPVCRRSMSTLSCVKHPPRHPRGLHRSGWGIPAAVLRGGRAQRPSSGLGPAPSLGSGLTPPQAGSERRCPHGHCSPSGTPPGFRSLPSSEAKPHNSRLCLSGLRAA